MRARSAVVLGGGLSGMAAALGLARAGWSPVTVIERDAVLGGLAGTFERDGRFYPLAYHHVLHRDRTLLHFLDSIGALDRVRWRKIRMLFRVDGRLLDLARPLDFLRFPMGLGDKLGFARLMLRSFRRTDWSEWSDRSGAELVDSWAGPGVRRALFDPLCRLKFDLPSAEVSAAWLGARLHFREGSAPLGYIPGANWTKVLCEGVCRLMEQARVCVRAGATVRALHAEGGRAGEVELESGERIGADVFVSTLPTPIYRSVAPGDGTAQIGAIRYTAVLSAVCAAPRWSGPDFYWLNLLSHDRQASGLFLLSSLNPTIGAPGEACLNFVTHLPSRRHELFGQPDERLWAGYQEDFREIFGRDLEPSWRHITRLPLYSPVFVRGYANPPVRSSTLANVYFAGNYRTFPSVASTGTALGSGLDAAAAAIEDHGGGPDPRIAARAFRLRSMPREGDRD